jgi:hypothetical protein
VMMYLHGDMRGVPLGFDDHAPVSGSSKETGETEP